MKLTLKAKSLQKKKLLIEASDDYVVATLAEPFKGLAKGDSVKMDALDFTKRGDNDMIDIIMPDGSKAQVKKRILFAKI